MAVTHVTRASHNILFFSLFFLDLNSKRKESLNYFFFIYKIIRTQSRRGLMEQPKGRSHLLPIHHPCKKKLKSLKVGGCDFDVGKWPLFFLVHYMYKNIRYFWMSCTVWIGTRFLGSGSIFRIVDPMLLEPARGI